MTQPQAEQAPSRLETDHVLPQSPNAPWPTSAVRFGFLLIVKYLARIFYRFEVDWAEVPPKPWSDVRLMVMLNHTSLFEPLYMAKIPNRHLWKIARRGIYPGADKTMDRPIVGRFFKHLTPGAHSITRKRDDSWERFLGGIYPESVVMILPEGRMKRRSGLDSLGNEMSIKKGIVDVLERLDQGNMVLCYSRGLHHIQAPGEWPKLFKTVRAKMEQIPIRSYKEDLMRRSEDFAKAVVLDLEEKRRRYCINELGLES